MNTIVKTTTFNGKTSRGHKDIYWGFSCLGSQFGFRHSDPRSDLIPVHVAALGGVNYKLLGRIFLEFWICFCSWSLPADFYHWCPLSAQTWYKSHDPFLLLTLHLMPANSQLNRCLTRPAVHDPLVLDGHHVSGLHLQSDVVLLRVH